MAEDTKGRECSGCEQARDRGVRITDNEAALSLHALRGYAHQKGCEVSENEVVLIEKLDAHFDVACE